MVVIYADQGHEHNGNAVGRPKKNPFRMNNPFFELDDVSALQPAYRPISFRCLL
jgi:hypothetical protein